MVAEPGIHRIEVTTLGDLLKQSHYVENSPALAGRLRVMLLFVGLGAISWLTMARIVRGQVLTLRTRAFVEASRTLGAGAPRILFRHIIPNIFGIVITYVALTMPAIILYESFLSYLGLGVQPPMASWGTLIAEGVSQINAIRIYWWLIVFPGGVLVEEREALAVNALVALTRYDEARERADSFLRHYPNSLLRASVQSALAAIP